MTPEQKLAGAGLTLPPPHPLVGTFALVAQRGDVLYVSGHGAFADGEPIHRGKLGADLTTAEGKEAAQAVMLALLGSVRDHIGGLDRVNRVLKVLVFVNSTPEFSEHHLVANGSTEVLATAFGKERLPARSAIGVSSLPLGFAVEVEAIVEIAPAVP
ncbi:RidA family protein [Pseudarthrobacter sp. NamE2]|uniref:RidA family protein n=1 Tax=Pseudarthrobacter sp. NamE2 TaxID=2576838 RepID=UPI0010FED2B8|nr:RidA family protein [Pseudarthrobacter sp. NamE2]TLM86451.1 RidA family protein [Pseudarthrobacter sp. NamE2]